MSKSIRVSEGFHELVKAHKHSDETMDETLRRLVDGPGPEVLAEIIGTSDEETARQAADLLATTDREAGGNSGVDTEDALIGAVAEQYDEPVLTANEADFRSLGVDIEPY